jgi:hypothetical protein
MNKTEMEFKMPEHEIRDIYKEIDHDENLVMAEVDGKLTTIICEGFGNRLVEFEEFAQRAANGQTGFHVVRNAFGLMSITNGQLAQYFPSLNHFISLYEPCKSYSPHVEAAYAQIAAMGLGDCELSKEPADLAFTLQRTGADLFNELIERINRACQTPEFKRKLNTREYNAVRNFRSVAAYIAALFEHCKSRLLAIRVDFGFAIHPQLHPHEITLAEAQAYLDRFLNNRRGRALFNHLVGYVWKLEYGRLKGYHFHLCFLFDGAQVENHSYIAMKIGEYWRELTDGRGTYHSCHTNKRPYSRSGIGMIEHDDFEKRSNLLYALSYFFKKEQYVKVKLTEKARVCGRGEMPKVRSSTVGRPRRSVPNESAFRNMADMLVSGLTSRASGCQKAPPPLVTVG